MSDQTPETEITTQAQLLRAIADLVERHAPDLPASDWHHVYVSSFAGRPNAIGVSRARQVLQALMDAGAAVAEEEVSGYFVATVQLGQTAVKFKFDRYDVAERRVEVREQETWVLAPASQESARVVPVISDEALAEMRRVGDLPLPGDDDTHGR